MVVKPKVKGFMCTTAHPEGCRAAVKAQIDYVKTQPKTDGPKKVLVIGASMGYGLSSRIVATYTCGADTIGVIFDKPGREKHTGTAGWYNTKAFEQFAAADGYYAKSVNGDAYSQEVKDEVTALIKKDWGTVDFVVYSIAAPRRKAPDGQTYRSVIKTVGQTYTNHTIDLVTNEYTEVTIEPATQQEVDDTVKVMGGEDWKLWMDALNSAGVLAPNAMTVAYSYIGPELTHPMYYDGTIGAAKKDLYRTAEQMRKDGLSAYVSINKAVVTQSSAAIPVVPLYIALLFQEMKKRGLHEDCIQQMYRMMHDKLFAGKVETDENGFVRLDDYEMQTEIQEKIKALWDEVNSDNMNELADISGYWDAFYEIFGFGIDGVDYDADVDIS